MAGSQALLEGVLGGERRDLADDLGVAAGGKIGVESALDRQKTDILEPPDLTLQAGHVDQVGVRPAPPHAERGREHCRGVLGVGGQRGAGLCRQTFEAAGINVVGVDLKTIAMREALDPAADQPT